MVTLNDCDALIRADILIPGRGEPLMNRCLIVNKGKIVSILTGDSSEIKNMNPKHQVHKKVVMPGCWDCHTHMIGVPENYKGNLLAFVLETGANGSEVRAIRAGQQIKKVLMAGFTSVREVGGLGHVVRQAIKEGYIMGPNIYPAGRILSMTGGHCDIHQFPLECVRHQDIGIICDGIPECLKAVRQNLRIGASVIKICASGGVMSELDDPIHQQFSDDELKAIVEEAARADLVVAAHCHGKPGIMAALRTGCKTIEHGTYCDEECIEMIKEKNAILVPTQWVINKLVGKHEKENEGSDQLNRIAGLSDANWEKIEGLYQQNQNAIRLAIKRGVKIAVGCDIFLSAGYGTNGKELTHLLNLGMTPLEVIEAATANGPETIGEKRAPLSGQLKEGYDADILCLDANPLDDISLLENPDNIKIIFKTGEIVKDIK